MHLNIEPQELYFFDIYLRKLLISKPVNSLRSHGSHLHKPKRLQLIYEGSIKENEKGTIFEIRIIASENEIGPLEINVKGGISEEEKKPVMRMLVSRITEAERMTKEKPLESFEYEAHLSTGFYPMKITIEFGKYKLSPLEERSEEGWLCKLRFPVEAINKDDSLTWATVEARQIAAWLSLIFNVLFRFQYFSEVGEDIAPIIHFEKIERPDLRPVKHPFAGELKIPCDFLELWNHLNFLPPNIVAAFMSSCVCFQVAKEMCMTHIGIAYTLFVTAIEVIAEKVMKIEGYKKRFVEFICQGIGRSDEEFRTRLKDFYKGRSEVLHEEGVGLGLIPTFGIISFDVVPGDELWSLEVIVNAALIGFLKDPKKFGVLFRSDA